MIRASAAVSSSARREALSLSLRRRTTAPLPAPAAAAVFSNDVCARTTSTSWPTCSVCTRLMSSGSDSTAGGCPITGKDAGRSKSTAAAAHSASSTEGATSSSSGSSSAANVELRIVPTLPYLGSIVPQWSDTPVFDPSKYYDFYPELRRRYGDFYRMGFPGLGKGRDALMYVVTDPSEMQKIIRQERSKRPYPRGIVEAEWPLVHWLQQSGSILAKGTNDAEDRLGFAGRGETWKRLRTFLQTDLLSPQAAAGYVPGMVRAAELASKGAPASSDDLNAYTNRCSFDLFNSLMFGSLTKMADPNTGHDKENILFCDSSVVAMETMLAQLTSPMQLLLFKLGIRTSLYKDMASSFSTAFDIAGKKYEAFRKKSDANDLSESEKSSYLGRAIVRQAEEGSNISEEDLVELINIALIAAIDTTSSLLSWNIMHIALNPDIQEKLHAELTESVKVCGGLNAEALKKGRSPYLYAVVRESHRLTPAAPVTVMKENSLSDVEVHGSLIPKDSLVCLDAYSVGKDEAIVDEPEDFRPERWLPDAVEARKGTPAEILDHPFYRDPFSQGSRKCPGSRVANNEVLILLSQLVLDWKISPPVGYGKDDVEYALKGMIHPAMPKLNFLSRCSGV